VTQILGPTNASLFAFTKAQFNSFHLRGVSLITNSACSTCTAVSLIEGDSFTVAGYSAQNDFTDVVITGSDPSDNIPSGNNYWETGINIFGVSNINFNNVYIQGIQNSSGPTPGTSRGIVVAGDATHVPVVLNLVGVSINLYNRAFEYGPWTQGVTITASNLIGNKYGVYVSSLVNQLAGQLSIANSSANNCSNVFVANQVPGLVAITGIQITNNILISAGQPWPCPATTSILLGESSTYSFVSNNDFGGASSYTGVNFAGPSYTAGKVVHNMFNGFGVAIDTTPNPAATTTGGLIDGNTITNSGIGIQIGVGTDDFVVSNNILQGNTTNLQNNIVAEYTNYIDIPQDCSGLAGVGITFGGANTGITYSSQTCQYAVIGRQGFLDIDYTLSSKGSATGQAGFQMPAVANAVLPGGSGIISFAGSVVGLFGPLTGVVNQTSSVMNFFQWQPPGGTVGVTDANFQNTTRIKARVELRVPSVYP
jgi:hypothetical protein